MGLENWLERIWGELEHAFENMRGLVKNPTLVSFCYYGLHVLAIIAIFMLPNAGDF